MITKTDLKKFDLFIDGKMITSKDDAYFQSMNPSTGEVFAQIADATQDDMEAAIAAARKAFDCGPWKDLSVAQRGVYLKKIAKLIRDHAKELSELEVTDVGKTTKQVNFIDVPAAADAFDYYGNISDEVFKERNNAVHEPAKSSTCFEPYGVVGSICSFNYPLIYAAWKVAPVIISGNTIVFKPSPLACASIMRLAQLIAESGIPEGVINIVPTQDDQVASLLAQSDQVNMLSFTGSTKTGRLIMQQAAMTTKKISLELGGKSPGIIFADCNIDSALGGALSGIFMNQGQMCTAISRLYVEETIYDEVLKKLVDKTVSLKVGDASQFTTEFGPVISKEQRERILNSIEGAIKEGAKISCGGRIPQDTPEGGFYIEPTILTEVGDDMRIIKEEVFGPVLCVMKFNSEDEVLARANDSIYGLAASVWTKDKGRIQRFTKELQCGTVWINTYGGFFNESSFGGYKQSGFGRESGIEGLFEYIQTKHVCVDETPGGMPLAASWF